MDQEYRCTECGKIFGSEETLDKHSLMEHGYSAKIIEATNHDLLPHIPVNRTQVAGFVVGIILAGALFGGYTYAEDLEPTVKITVVTCDNCSYSEFQETTDEIIKADYREVDYQSDEGQRLAERYDLNYVPGFIFDKEVEEAENFTRIRSTVVEFEDAYVLPDKGIEAAQRESEGINLDR